MFRKKSYRHRREFLLDSNQTSVRKPKIMRNRFLNFLGRLIFVRQIMKLFRVSFLFGTIFIIMAVFVIFAIFSPYFNLKKINVLRDNPHLDIEHIHEVLKDFKGKNLLFLTDTEIKNILMENFLEFRNIDISENWPDEIILSIQVSPPFLNLLNTETANFAVVSEDGVILQEGANEELPVLKVFQYEKPLLARQRFADKEDLQKITMAEKFLEQEVKLPLKASHFYWNAHELHLISRGDMAIWIDLSQPIEAQLQKLEFSANKIGLYTKEFEHIDLRIPEHIFWKYK